MKRDIFLTMAIEMDFEIRKTLIISAKYSLILAGLAWFLLALPLAGFYAWACGLSSVVFGVYGINQIQKHKKYFTGIGVALAGIVVGLLFVVFNGIGMWLAIQ